VNEESFLLFLDRDWATLLGFLSRPAQETPSKPAGGTKESKQFQSPILGSLISLMPRRESR
jgi:hypothetical protein